MRHFRIAIASLAAVLLAVAAPPDRAGAQGVTPLRPDFEPPREYGPPPGYEPLLYGFGSPHGIATWLRDAAARLSAATRLWPTSAVRSATARLYASAVHLQVAIRTRVRGATTRLCATAVRSWAAARLWPAFRLRSTTTHGRAAIVRLRATIRLWLTSELRSATGTTPL
jgi:hypothetical protein